ncbi:odorant receptor 22c-like [Aricia agestis]|uniref:odorant receptor 22c-like n=1 Tax=Aricia agestis TaxID=91739 RepID=UPI001C20BC12|nr:odorant receptor 22c-like [Aricia agestis]
MGAYLVTWSAIIAYCYVYIFSMHWFIFVRCQETGDLVAASVVFSLGTNSSTEEMCELISRYLECDTKVAPKTRFHTNLQKQLKVVKRRALSVWMCLVGIAYLYASMALLRPGRHFPEDLYVVYGLEPPFETPNYEISLFLMALSITVAVYQLSAVKALVIVMIGYVESQVLALSEECLQIWNDVSEENDKRHQNSFDEERQTDGHPREEIMNLQIRFKLVNILQFHAYSVKLLQDFEKLYRWISFVDFMMIVFAIISELLGKVQNTYLEIPYTVVQIYIDCYIGQKLTDANEVFCNAIYDCKWENFDVKNRKIVLMLLRNSQKPIEVTAGGISPLNYATFMSIMKTSYSAYTTLQSSVS